MSDKNYEKRKTNIKKLWKKEKEIVKTKRADIMPGAAARKNGKKIHGRKINRMVTRLRVCLVVRGRLYRISG